MSKTLGLVDIPSSSKHVNHTPLARAFAQNVVDNADAAPPRAPSSPEHATELQTEPAHPTNANIALTMMSLCLSVLLSALDLTIVTPADPAIVGSLKSAAGYTWVGGAYTLAYAAVTPVWGLVCALAPKMNALVVGRAIQGAGGSGMGIMVNIIVSDMFSLRDRGLYLAITSLTWAVGSAIGPVLAGDDVFGSIVGRTASYDGPKLTQSIVPVGAFSVLVLLFFLRVQSPRTPITAGLKVIDWTGSVLIVGGALMVLLALEFGDVAYSWSSATVICLLIFGTAVMALFMAYYLPLYAQSVLAATALTSGLYLLPLIVSCALAAAAAEVFMQRTGKYLPVMYIAQGFLVLGSGLLISLKFEANITKLIIFQILMGVGVGMNIEAPILAAQAAENVRDTAAVTATMGFVRSLSTAISVVVGASMFNGGNAASNVEEIQNAGLSTDQQIMVRKTYFEALRVVWVMCVAFAGLAAILNLFVRARKLRTENEGAVLGIDRSRQQGSPMSGVVE
ncbi:uncharacterized protein N7506_003639 [Penicillium brevicompactum]|uniref:uncharacterized protein n=1 Tax=Penicillium brevicompactum TaxID=5074 RepID=UPI0025402281|nr:uncharacterized protein N7506_003639 [Penicillium brevicompactum]KAJ5343815.1 hypothetical protein N7506_003639 [Penicillium brevicompactum]